MLILLYFLTFGFCLLVTVRLLHHKRIITSIVSFSFLLTVSSFGRCLIGISSTLELARLGNFLLFVSTCFCPLLLVHILAQFCDNPLPKWLSTFLTLLSCAVFCLAIPFSGFHLFYKGMTLKSRNCCSYLVRESGPLHFLFPVMLLIYLTVCVLLLIKAVRKNRKTYLKTVIGSVTAVSILVVLYIADRILGNNLGLFSHGFILSMVLLLWRMEKVNMYDLLTNIAASIDALNENAYIQFDMTYRCVGVNEKIRTLFPEIDQTWKIGKKVPESDSFLYREIILWMLRRKKGEKKTVQIGDKFYELIVRDIPYLHKKCVGYLLAFVDRTPENKYLQAMESYQTTLEQEVQLKTERISHIKDMLVVGIASMIESRDDSTGDHIKRTYAVMQVFSENLKKHCKKLGVTEDFLDMVTRAAPMHDLGKIAVDDAVLKKQGKFTEEDFELMKVHPAEGAKIVRQILTGIEDPEFINIADNVAHYHHEKWDGTGYPDGLKGEEIPLEARIMALPDVFDALSSKRYYKEALPFDVVFPMIEEGLGTHFDPVLGKLFLQCRPELEKMYRKWYEEDMDDSQLQLTPLKAEKSLLPSMPVAP